MNTRGTYAVTTVSTLALSLLLTGCSLIANIENVSGALSDEKAKVSLDVMNVTMSEGASALINVTLNDRRTTDTVINVRLSSARNDVAADFLPYPASITIPAHALSTPLRLTSVQDSLYEADEEFTLLLSSDDATVEIERARTTITVFDDDSGAPHMLKDINLAPDFRTTFKMNDARILFENSDPDHGNELWVTDGSEAGTRMIMDINPGAASSSPGITGSERHFFLNTTTNIVFFPATTPGEGSEIWRTDGTSAGTFLVADTQPGANSITGVYFLGEVGSRVLMYVVRSTGFYGDVWSSDGTSAGTYKVASGYDWTSANAGVTYGGVLYFGGRVGTNGTTLWRSDGTDAGTVIVKETGGYSFADSAPGRFSVVNGKMYFLGYSSAAGQEPWISDGTSAGTQLLKDIYPSSSSSNSSVPLSVGATAIFGAVDAGGSKVWVTDGTSGGTNSLVSTIFEEALGTLPGKAIFAGFQSASGIEPWVSDGTVAGTVMLKEIASGTTGSLGYSSNIHAVANGRLFFVATDGTSGTELWVTDGTPAGTALLKDIYPGPLGSNPGDLTVVGTKLVFAATSAAGRELWVTDGTAAGTAQLADTIPGTASLVPTALTALDNDRYFFTGYNSAIHTSSAYVGDVNGRITPFNSAVVPNASSNVSSIAALGSNIIFGAVATGPGNPLWKSDGTTAGTAAYADLFPTQSCTDVSILGVYGSSIFFQATSPQVATGLEQTDGTYAGTSLIVDANGTTFGSMMNAPVQFSATQMIFDALDQTYGRETWITDGSAAGTFMLKDILPGSAGSTTYFTPVVNQTQHLAYLGANTGSSTYTVWVTDGTSAGTVQLTTLGSPTMLHIYPAGTKTYIAIATSNTADLDLWVTDGTNAHTVKITPAGSYLSTVFGTAVIGEKLFFGGRNNTYGREPWVSDGTTAGTYMLKDLTVGTGSTSLQYIRTVGSKVVFGSPSNIGFSDLTTAGTSVTAALGFGVDSSTVEFNGKLYYSYNDGVHGYEVWSTDGTLAGTAIVKDIRPGSNGSNPNNFAVFHSQLYFSATDDTHGSELWKTDGTAAGTQMVIDANPGIAGSDPSLLQVLQGKLYWKATTLMNGTELWMLSH